MRDDHCHLDATDVKGHGVRVTFARRMDRYVHAIAALASGETIGMLESWEDGSEEPWPRSPPFQQLSIEKRQDGAPVALLVGMAGKSHWSASIEVAADRPRISFDIACLARQTPVWLGSSYRIAAGVVVQPQHGAISLEVAGANYLLSIETIAGNPSAEGKASDALITIAYPGKLELPPVTCRWKFSLELLPGE